MQANELRIGNLVQYFYENQEGTVKKIRHDDFGWLITMKDVPQLLNKMKPIPLTAEILEACGFKEFNKSTTGHRQWWLEENPVTLDFMLVIRFVPEYGFFYGNAFHQVKYVHQLQNLYFALTSKELEVKL